jgi:large subunit ribosomal protein L21
MEAIVKISGKQYRLSEGQRVTVDRLESPVGDEVTFDQVLMLTDGTSITIGTPVVVGAAVTARVVSEPRGPKLVVYKYKAKKRYRRTQGFRASQSLLEIVSVTGAGEKKSERKAAAKPAEKSAVAGAKDKEKPEESK